MVLFIENHPVGSQSTVGCLVSRSVASLPYQYVIVTMVFNFLLKVKMVYSKRKCKFQSPPSTADEMSSVGHQKARNIAS